jgi:predicted ester cyclase
MGVEENKANVRRLWEEGFNKGNLSVVDEVMSSNYILHGPFKEYDGPQGFKNFITMYRDALSDIRSTVDDMIAEGNKVVTIIRLSGTFTNPIIGLPPTGKEVTITGVFIDRFENSRDVETSLISDMLAWFYQFGANPPGKNFYQKE